MALKVGNGLDLQNQRIQAVASPSSGTDAANKDYVDGLVTGASWKVAVRAATTANAVLASAFENGDTIDGVTLATGDRILIKNQTTGGENGIYIVNATGAPTRAADADTTAELRNATVFVREGTVGADTAWTQTAEIATVGTTAQTWAQFGTGGGSSYTFSQGVQESAGTVTARLDGTSLSQSGSGLRIGSAAAANGLVEASGLLSVGAGTGITVNANDVAVTVPFAKFAATVGGSTTINVDHNLATTDVIVEVFEVSSGVTVLCDVTRSTTNRVVLGFAVAPGASSLRVVVHA